MTANSTLLTEKVLKQKTYQHQPVNSAHLRWAWARFTCKIHYVAVTSDIFEFLEN